MTPGRKIGLLGALYFAQGLPFGFFTQALPVMMRSQGISRTVIGLSSLLALPWALKFLWAPLVDHHHSPRLGRRRSWILPLQAAAVALVLGVAALDPERHFALLIAAVLLANLVAATQDIATDGLAVDLLAPAERGLGNGVQVAGYRVGMVIGGGVLLIVFDALGWRLSFVVMAALLAAASLPVLRHREAPAPATQPHAQRRPQRIVESLLGFVRRPGARAWLGAIMLYKVGGAFAGAMVRPMLVDLGLELEEIGWIFGLVGSLTGLLGALAGGALVARLGRRNALVAFGLGESVAVTLYLAPLVVPMGLVGLGVLSGIEHFVGGMATAALFTTMMDACAPERGATDYTLQASAVVVASGVAGALSGAVADAVGYAPTYLLGAVLCALGVQVIARTPPPAAPIRTALD